MWNQTELESLTNAIYHRKSISKFKVKSLSKEALIEVEKQIKKIVPLYEKKEIAFRVLNSTQVKGRKIEHAYHLDIYAKESIEAYTNASFMLQQMDLWFSANNIVSWWHGITRPLPEFETVNGLPLVVICKCIRNKSEL